MTPGLGGVSAPLRTSFSTPLLPEQEGRLGTMATRERGEPRGAAGEGLRAGAEGRTTPELTQARTAAASPGSSRRRATAQGQGGHGEESRLSRRTKQGSAWTSSHSA